MSTIDSIIPLIHQYNQSKIKQEHNFDLISNIEIAHHGSALEGSTLTLAESTNLILKGAKAKGKPLEHHLMVTDHYEAIKAVRLHADNKRILNQPISSLDIQTICAVVKKNTGTIVNTILGNTDETKGDYRKCSVSAGNHIFMSYNKVSDEVTKLVRDLNYSLININSDDFLQQLTLSFEAQYRLVTIHPFTDGNGRTARLLSNFIQQYYKLPLGIVYSENKKEYIEALQTTRIKSEISYIFNFLSEQYLLFLENFAKENIG